MAKQLLETKRDCGAIEKILFISSIYPRTNDPTRGTFCLATCRALAKKRLVRVVSPVAWTEARRAGDPQWRAPKDAMGEVLYPTYWYPPGIARGTYATWMWHSTKSTLRRVAAEFRPDAILSYWAHPDGAVALRLARELGIPCGITVGGSDVLLLPQDRARKRAIAATLCGADAVFAVSNDIRRHAIALGARADAVHVVMQGVDESFTPGDRSEARAALGLAPDRAVLLWVGRMEPVKGLEVLIDALPGVIREIAKVQLILVGDGSARAMIERRCSKLGIGDRVHFAGRITTEQLPEWYRAADLTVLSSHSEGIPNVLRESLACGTPYVSTRVGGVAELHEGPAARLVPPADPTAMAQAIVASLRSPASVPHSAVERGWAARAEELVMLLQARPAASGKAA